MCAVSEAVSALKICDPVVIGSILHAKGLYSTPHSARTNAQKKLNYLVSLQKLERGDGFYRVPGCTSEYKDHARLLTLCLAEILKLTTVNSYIHREHSTPVALRSDAICLITRDNRGLCFILEVLINEPPEYIQMKQNTWANWDGANDYLSQLFKYKIPSFEVVPVTDVVGFKSYLQEVI